MGFELDGKSLSKLDGIFPPLAKVVLAAARASQQPFIIEQGIRSEAEELKHCQDGTSRTMNSMHLKQKDGFGHAVDLVPVVAGLLLWQLPPSQQWAFIYPVAAAMQQEAIAASVMVRWGGCWDRDCRNFRSVEHRRWNQRRVRM